MRQLGLERNMESFLDLRLCVVAGGRHQVEVDSWRLDDEGRCITPLTPSGINNAYVLGHSLSISPNFQYLCIMSDKCVPSSQFIPSSNSTLNSLDQNKTYRCYNPTTTKQVENNELASWKVQALRIQPFSTQPLGNPCTQHHWVHSCSGLHTNAYSSGGYREVCHARLSSPNPDEL